MKVELTMICAVGLMIGGSASAQVFVTTDRSDMEFVTDPHPLINDGQGYSSGAIRYLGQGSYSQDGALSSYGNPAIGYRQAGGASNGTWFGNFQVDAPLLFEDGPMTGAYARFRPIVNLQANAVAGIGIQVQTLAYGPFRADIREQVDGIFSGWQTVRGNSTDLADGSALSSESCRRRLISPRSTYA